MTEIQVEGTEGTADTSVSLFGRHHRACAVTFLLDAALGALIPVPINWEKGFVLDAIGKMLLVVVAGD